MDISLDVMLYRTPQKMNFMKEKSYLTPIVVGVARGCIVADR